jgi:hypothetical protein
VHEIYKSRADSYQKKSYYRACDEHAAETVFADTCYQAVTTARASGHQMHAKKDYDTGNEE